MPWKLVGFIICLVLGTCFAGYNLGNNCNISFGFHTFENVPIFFSLIVAFACGVVVTLPFTVIKKKSAKEKKVQAEERAMKKIKKEQEKEAKALALAEKTAAKEAKLAQKEAKKLEKQQKTAENPVVPVEPVEKG
jgi:mannitol-specific phosphotransferase system IIBC component